MFPRWIWHESGTDRLVPNCRLDTIAARDAGRGDGEGLSAGRLRRLLYLTAVQQPPASISELLVQPHLQPADGRTPPAVSPSVPPPAAVDHWRDGQAVTLVYAWSSVLNLESVLLCPALS